MSAPSNSPRSRSSSGLSVDQLVVDEHTVVVSLEGDIDLWSAPHLKTVLCDLLDAGRTGLVLDLARVGFMDSTALGVMVGIHRRLRRERMAIAAATPAVLRVFEMSGLATGFRVFPTREAAVSYVTEEEAGTANPGKPPLTADAALMLGIASTAMPFAQSAEDQAERWLRALRNHGESGAILASLGLSEAVLDEREYASGHEAPAGRGDPDAVGTVTARASQMASQRGAPKLATTDVLLAVIEVYGPTFYRVLSSHGVDPAELSARIASGDPVSAEG